MRALPFGVLLFAELPGRALGEHKNTCSNDTLPAGEAANIRGFLGGDVMRLAEQKKKPWGRGATEGGIANREGRVPKVRVTYL